MFQYKKFQEYQGLTVGESYDLQEIKNVGDVILTAKDLFNDKTEGVKRLDPEMLIGNNGMRIHIRNCVETGKFEVLRIYKQSSDA